MARSRILFLVCLMMVCRSLLFVSIALTKDIHLSTSLKILFCSSFGGIGIKKFFRTSKGGIFFIAVPLLSLYASCLRIKSK